MKIDTTFGMKQRKKIRALKVQNEKRRRIDMSLKIKISLLST